IVRPSAVTITPDPSGSAVLQDLRFLGHGYLMIIAAGEQRLRAMSDRTPQIEVGASVALSFDSSGVLVYFSD
ncbi:MAG: TOBE domain-containing protein, partial [Pseudomonadota bacterium]